MNEKLIREDNQEIEDKIEIEKEIIEEKQIANAIN